MRSSIGDKQRLLHILDAINEIDGFVGGLQAKIFFENNLIKSGTTFQLQVIGEAANHLSADLKKAYPDVDWKRMTGLRNIIAHFYWGTDYVQVWNIVKKDLPVLKETIQNILAEIE